MVARKLNKINEHNILNELNVLRKSQFKIHVSHCLPYISHATILCISLYAAFVVDTKRKRTEINCWLLRLQRSLNGCIVIVLSVPVSVPWHRYFDCFARLLNGFQWTSTMTQKFEMFTSRKVSKADNRETSATGRRIPPYGVGVAAVRAVCSTLTPFQLLTATFLSLIVCVYQLDSKVENDASVRAPNLTSTSCDIDLRSHDPPSWHLLALLRGELVPICIEIV